MIDYTVDETMEHLIRYRRDLTGYIDGEVAGLINEKDCATFFVGYDGCTFELDVPREELDTAILYKGKTIKGLLEEGIFYNAIVW